MKLFSIPDFVFRFREISIPFCDPCMNFPDQFAQFSYIDEIQSEQFALHNLPQSLMTNLYDFQKKGVEYAVKRFGRVLLGDEMGIGKTIQAIAIMQLYRQDWPLMIFCPSSIKYIWRDELQKWLGADIGQWDI